MSDYTREYLAKNILVGFTDEYGPAWHHEDGDDNHYPGAIPVEDVLSRQFNWEALEADVFYHLPDGTLRGADNAKIIYRSDNYATLGVHSQKWTMHSYRKWLLDNVGIIMDDTAGSDTLQISSAGQLKYGAVAFVQFQMPQTQEAPNGERFRPFLAAATSMDGSLASTYKRGVVRWVCDNTMNAGMAESGGTWKVKHTLNSVGRLKDARDALGVVMATADNYMAEMESLMAQSVTDKQWGSFIEAYVPIEAELKPAGVTRRENKRMALTQLYNDDPRVSPWAGSAWGVLQAVTTYQQHERGFIHESTNRVSRNWMDFLDGKSEDVEVEALKTLATVL